MEKEESIITEFVRDSSKDEERIIAAIKEIPFGVGKNLLADFLRGDYVNGSIVKNSLDELASFGCLHIDRDEILEKISLLEKRGIIIIKGNSENPFMKLIRLKEDVEREESSYEYESKTEYPIFKETQITAQDKMVFGELDHFLKDYNDEQKKGIIHQGKNILCVAGAGSGKTAVLVKRIEFLVKYCGVEKNKILAITFTRKAREEMAIRLGENGISVNVETFNSFCEKILQKYSNKIYSRPTRVIKYQEKMIAMSMALMKMKLSLDEAIGKYFSKNQMKNKTRDELVNIFMNDSFSILEYFKMIDKKLYDFSVECEEDDKDKAKMIYTLCVELEHFMKMNGLRDFYDQVIDVISFFKKNPNDIPEYEHILVDEYQDVNSTQILLLELLKKNNLFCVGDPRQSIFGWRGSDISYIMNFTQRHEGSEVIVLKKNYRSTKKIVEFMNTSIVHTKMPPLQSHKTGDEEIKIHKFESEIEEHYFVSQLIKKSQIRRKEIFVLGRTNKQIAELGLMLKKNDIHFVVKNDESPRNIEAKEHEVTLATIHSIKGLEAKMVIVIGCNESNFPCKASDHPIIEMIKLQDYDKEEEERRLFYVAISRAKEKLYLSYSGRKKTNFITEEMESIIK